MKMFKPSDKDANSEIAQLRLLNRRSALFLEHSIRGNFDIDHLCKLNAIFMKDELNINESSEITASAPSAMRKELVAESNDWIKKRNDDYYIAYSRMDEAAYVRLKEVLERANPERLAAITGKDLFVKELASIYEELDYIHPFIDGNSRTLREFTRCLAEESGYKLDWTKLNTTEGRLKLTNARDKAVCDKAIQAGVKSLALEGLLFRETKMLLRDQPALVELLLPLIERKNNIKIETNWWKNMEHERSRSNVQKNRRN